MRVNVLLAVLTCFCGTAVAQDLRPGLPGMAPSRWITVKNTHAPGRVYQSLNTNARTYTQEDTYVKLYIPVARTSRFIIVVAPHFRTEEMELKRITDDGDRMGSMRLRSIGLDLKAVVRLDSTSWLMTSGSVSQAGDISAISPSHIPLSYTLSSVYLKRVAPNKELGVGLLVNKASSLLVLPVFIYNHNFSARYGLEVSLPHKIAWRYNASPTDIFHVKAEANTRTYFVGSALPNHFELFRRIDVDLGVSYNKQFTKFMGAELFAGYRQNLSNRLPENVTALRCSGFVGSAELYIRPPQGLFQKRR